MTDLSAQLVVAGIVVYLFEMVKKAKWVPWITQDTKQLNKILAASVAALAALGIHWQFDPQSGTLLITGLTASSIQTAAWEYAKQLVLQQGFYDLIVAKDNSVVRVEMPPLV